METDDRAQRSVRVAGFSGGDRASSRGVPIEQATAEMRVLDRPRVEDIARIFGNAEWLKARLESNRQAPGGSCCASI